MMVKVSQDLVHKHLLPKAILDRRAPIQHRPNTPTPMASARWHRVVTGRRPVEKSTFRMLVQRWFLGARGPF
jgi:hypothetical protein